MGLTLLSNQRSKKSRKSEHSDIKRTAYLKKEKQN